MGIIQDRINQYSKENPRTCRAMHLDQNATVKKETERSFTEQEICELQELCKIGNPSYFEKLACSLVNEYSSHLKKK